MNRKFQWMLAIAISAMLIADQVGAATVTWSGSSLIGDGTADISSAGSLVEAHNAGAVTAITAGGVLFDALEPFPLNNTFSGANPTNITGNANFDALLDSASFGSPIGRTYTIDQLTPGVTYQAQFFVTDSRGCCDVRTVTLSDGTNSLTSGPIGLGFAFTGTFTASGTTQNVIFSGDGASYLNAWQLRDVSAVPEPEIYAMLVSGLGLVGFAARRRKQREAAAA